MRTTQPVVRTGELMGTTYSIQVVEVADANAIAAVTAAVTAMQQVDQTMSTYKPDSELSRLNTNASTQWIEASPALAYVIDQAQAISRKSDGYFDITVGPLVNLWSFGPEHTPDAIPSVAAIAERRGQIGYQKLQVRMDSPAVRKQSGNLYLDLSAIAKGYAVDQAAAALERAGMRNYLVELGGEIRVKGHNAQKKPWRIAVEKPIAETRAVERLISLSDGAVATSGDYRNFFEIGGRRYSHEIDPKTGWPISNGVVSVTVLADNAMLADGWATALIVLGADRGLAVAEQEKLAVLFIVKSGDQYSERGSSFFQRRFGS